MLLFISARFNFLRTNSYLMILCSLSCQVAEVYTDVPKALNHLLSWTTDVQDSESPGFLDIKEEVILLVSQSRFFHLLTETHRCCVVRDLHYEVVFVVSSAVICQLAEDTALGAAGVEDALLLILTGGSTCQEIQNAVMGPVRVLPVCSPVSGGNDCIKDRN